MEEAKVKQAPHKKRVFRLAKREKSRNLSRSRFFSFQVSSRTRNSPRTRSRWSSTINASQRDRYNRQVYRSLWPSVIMPSATVQEQINHKWENKKNQDRLTVKTEILDPATNAVIRGSLIQVKSLDTKARAQEQRWFKWASKARHHACPKRSSKLASNQVKGQVSIGAHGAKYANTCWQDKFKLQIVTRNVTYLKCQERRFRTQDMFKRCISAPSSHEFTRNGTKWLKVKKPIVQDARKRDIDSSKSKVENSPQVEIWAYKREHFSKREYFSKLSQDNQEIVAMHPARQSKGIQEIPREYSTPMLNLIVQARGTSFILLFFRSVFTRRMKLKLLRHIIQVGTRPKRLVSSSAFSKFTRDIPHQVSRYKWNRHRSHSSTMLCYK